MRRVRQRPDTTAQAINLTPLIDMVFILLIFFIVTSSFVKETGVEVERPESVTAKRKEAASILVAITAEGEVWIDRQRIDIRRVRTVVERLHAESPESSAVVVADEDARMGLAVEVIDQIRLAGVQQVSVAASLEAAR
jgi:biopolymer transport protein ExbD